MITDLRLRGLEKLLIGLCPLHGTVLKLISTGDHTAEVVCQYEGYACILLGLLSRQKNVAKLKGLGYKELSIKFTNIEGKRVILTAEVFDFPL